LNGRLNLYQDSARQELRKMKATFDEVKGAVYSFSDGEKHG